VKTSSFRLYTGPGRISIARYAPRGTPAGFRIFAGLAPGSWFNSVSNEEYLRRYNEEILAKLDPKETYYRLGDMAAPHEPVLLCYEVPPFTAIGGLPEADAENGKQNWCHRRIVANFFQDALGIAVEEMDIDPSGIIKLGRGTGPKPRTEAARPDHVVPTGAEPTFPVVPTDWLEQRRNR
jgi:hypothetical protein